MAHPNRRQLLAVLAASPIVATGVGAFPRAVRAEAANAGLISPNVCFVTPEVTEGPYYFDADMERSDITEDRTGIPLDLKLQIVDAACNPLVGARVDLWHCDAEGNYSGYEQNAGGDTSGETYLRGTQMTGDDGTVTFETIYPGWYSGRTTHIHYKVFLDETTILTSQIFFPDALSEYLYENIEPYNARGATRDTVNANDSIAADVGDGGYAAIREQTGKYTADLVVGVDPNAVSSQSGMSGERRAGNPPEGGMPPEGGPGGPIRDVNVDLTNLIPTTEG